jgi:hypothetical protein
MGKLFWDTIKRLQNPGTSNYVKKTIQTFINKNGELPKSSKENVQNIADHLNLVYNTVPIVDRSVLNEIASLPEIKALGPLPTDNQIRKGIQQLSNGIVTKKGDFSHETIKAIAADPTLFAIIRKIILDAFSNGGVLNKDWLESDSKVLYKGKGNVHDPNFWRSINICSTFHQIIGNIIRNKLQQALDVVGCKEQFGFSPKIGCRDAVLSLQVALSKMKEHNQNSYVVFIDLIKAFDMVNRELLFEILLKFGIPVNLVNLIKKLHTDNKVTIKIGSDKIEINYKGGVKQGCTLAPTLFLFFIHYVFKVIDKNSGHIRKPEFKCSLDNVVCGRKSNSVGFAINLFRFIYADDSALIFLSREDMQAGMDIVYSVFEKFGLNVHVGRNGKLSKTEWMYFPCNGTKHLIIDKSSLHIGGATGGTISYTDSFKYLGTNITSNLNCDVDTSRRIELARAMFASLKKSIFANKLLPDSHKATAYNAFILPLLLYGAENWALKKSTHDRLERAHNYFVRIMSATSLHRIYVRHLRRLNPNCNLPSLKISNLSMKLGLESFDHYIFHRRLNWFGAAMRSPDDSLVRMILTCWVDSKRPVGRPTQSFGHSLIKDLKCIDVDISQWGVYAKNEPLWTAFSNLFSRKSRNLQQTSYLLINQFMNGN